MASYTVSFHYIRDPNFVGDTVGDTNVFFLNTELQQSDISIQADNKIGAIKELQKYIKETYPSILISTIDNISQRPQAHLYLQYHR